MIDVRLRNRVGAAELESKVGRILHETDYNLLLTGPTYVRKPDGKPLCIYLPGAMKDASTPEVYEILHAMRALITKNRGLASGSQRLLDGPGKRSYAMDVSSAIAGSFDPSGIYKYCRLTAWTGDHLPEWKRLQPFLQEIAKNLKEYVPDRYAAQAAVVAKTKPEWVVPGTPFSTITVNNTYPTGVHTDKGDLDAGFSTITCLRRGEFTGGHLTFPEYRMAVNLQDGDLILMDAHSFHGNTAIVCKCGNTLRGMCEECGSERISVVAYFRTAVAECGTFDEELKRAADKREKRVP